MRRQRGSQSRGDAAATTWIVRGGGSSETATAAPATGLRREFLRNHGARFGLPVPPPEPGDEPAPKAGGPDLRIADGLVDAPASYDEIETPWGTTPAPYETWPVPLPGAKPPADAMDTSEPEDDGDADDLLRHFAGRTDAPMDAAPMDAAPMDAAPTSPKRRAKKDRKKKSKKART